MMWWCAPDRTCSSLLLEQNFGWMLLSQTSKKQNKWLKSWLSDIFSTIRSSFTDESLFLTGHLFPTASWTKQTTNYPGDSRYRPGEEVHQRAPFRNFDGPHCIGGWVWLRCIPSIGYIGGEVFCLWLWWYAAKTQFTFYVLNWSESRPFSNNECNIENYILKMFTTHNNQCLRLGFKHMLCMPRLGWGCVISRHRATETFKSSHSSQASRFANLQNRPERWIAPKQFAPLWQWELPKRRVLVLRCWIALLPKSMIFADQTQPVALSHPSQTLHPCLQRWMRWPMKTGLLRNIKLPCCILLAPWSSKSALSNSLERAKTRSKSLPRLSRNTMRSLTVTASGFRRKGIEMMLGNKGKLQLTVLWCSRTPPWMLSLWQTWICPGLSRWIWRHQKIKNYTDWSLEDRQVFFVRIIFCFFVGQIYATAIGLNCKSTRSCPFSLMPLEPLCALILNFEMPNTSKPADNDNVSGLKGAADEFDDDDDHAW